MNNYFVYILNCFFFVSYKMDDLKYSKSNKLIKVRFVRYCANRPKVL